MRPIFLTSAAASVGVIPMIISRSPLWGPLGTVICFGLLISMVLTLFVLPVLYSVAYRDKSQSKKVKKRIPYLKSLHIKSVTMVIILLTIGGSLFVANAQTPVRTLSLDSCKSLAIENNKKIKDAGFEVKNSLEEKKIAFTNYFPKVSAMALAMRSSDYLIKGTTPSMNLPVYDGNLANLAAATQFAYVPSIAINAMDYLNMANVTLMQPVFAGGRIVNGNKLAKVGYDINQQKQRMTTTEVLVKTENLYWSTIQLQKKLSTLTAYEAMLNQLLTDVKRSVVAGLVQRSDLLKVQLKLNDLKVNRLKLEDGINLSKRALCQQIGITFVPSLQLEFPSIDNDLPQKYYVETQDAVSNRNEYQLLDKAVMAEKLQKKMAIGENLPQVSLGAVGYTSDVMHTTSTNAMAFVAVSVPISDWWSGSHKIKEAQNKINQAQTKLSETAELLGLQIEQAKDEMNETFLEISSAQSSIDQAKENLKVVTDNYKAGESSMSDLLEAQALYQDALNQYSDAICNYKIKIANYLQATGKYN
jgi:outer membrane protein TolC